MRTAQRLVRSLTGVTTRKRNVTPAHIGKFMCFLRFLPALIIVHQPSALLRRLLPPSLLTMSSDHLSFSWSDTLRAAFSPCLACLPSHSHDDSHSQSQNQNQNQNQNRGPDYVPRARADELEGLLADADADADAETLSLHSNIGIGKRKKRAREHGGGRSIRLFGYDLFGRPAQPIRLPEDDDVIIGGRGRTISSSTGESDAAPLDPSTIARLSAARDQEAEEEERRAKEERRARRRERKARKAAVAAALERGEGEDFEGFQVRFVLHVLFVPSRSHVPPLQGSGGLPSPSTRGPATHSSDGRSSATTDSYYGPFEPRAPAPRSSFPQEAVDDDDDADFDGVVYSKSTRGGSGTGSDSRSRTSGSTSNAPEHYNHHYISQSQPQLPAPSKSKRRSKSSRQSGSTARSESISTPPPYQTTFPAIAETPTPTQFPSVGFGGAGPRMGMGRKGSDAGVFLATRGD